METYNNTVVLKFDTSSSGNADSGALVTVRQASAVPGAGGLATIYDNLGVQILNPLATDADGNYSFQAANGTYDIVIREGQSQQYILQKERLSSETTLEPVIITPIDGQLIYPLPAQYASSVKAYVWIDGRKMIGSGANPDYYIDNLNNLILSEAIEENQTFEVAIDISETADQPVLKDTIFYFKTVSEALADSFILNGNLISIAETVTSDKTLIFWDVVLTASVTPNNWNVRSLTTNPGFSIVLRGTENLFFDKAYNEIKVFGHRGALKSAPQSTMTAFSQCLAAGIDGLEFDIQTDLDGQVWVFHDPNLSPDTQLYGAISASTTAYIETAVRQEANGTRLAGIGIVRLEEVLDFASRRKVKIWPELKFTGWTDANVDAVVQIFDDYGYNNDQCIITAVDIDLLDRVRVTSKTVTVAYGLNTDFVTAKPGIDRVIALGNGALSWDYTRIIAEPVFITYAYDNGLDLIAWIVDDSDAMQKLVGLGVRNFVSDTYMGGVIKNELNNNSLGLSFGKNWEGTKQYLLPHLATTGSSVSISGEVLTCTSIVGESSKASRHINVQAGEVITFAVLARLISGNSAGIAIDYPRSGITQTITPIFSNEWQWYEASAIIPITAVDDTNCVLQAGVFGSMNGTAEFMLPRVMKGNIQRGASQNLAMGQIYFDTADNNIPKINPGFVNNGIYALSYNVPTKELSITIDRLIRNDPEGAIDVTATLAIPTRPLFFGNVTFDNNGEQLSVKFSEYAYNTGVLKARFYDQSNTLVDITPFLSDGNIFINFKAEVN
tara:strand:+ start:35 stop:2380 length:2346 start_codon:yes stop_codon:yes gene_type:complete